MLPGAIRRPGTAAAGGAARDRRSARTEYTLSAPPRVHLRRLARDASDAARRGQRLSRRRSHGPVRLARAATVGRGATGRALAPPAGARGAGQL